MPTFNNTDAWAGRNFDKALTAYVRGDMAAPLQAAKNSEITLSTYSFYQPNPANTDKAVEDYSDIILSKEH